MVATVLKNRSKRYIRDGYSEENLVRSAISFDTYHDLRFHPNLGRSVYNTWSRLSYQEVTIRSYLSFFILNRIKRVEEVLGFIFLGLAAGGCLAAYLFSSSFGDGSE